MNRAEHFVNGHNYHQLFRSSLHLNLCKLLMLFCVAFIGVLFYKRFIKMNRGEGFTQTEKFVLAREDQIYDDFYCEIYDYLHVPQKRTSIELDIIAEHSFLPINENSKVLDIGSGTGDVLSELANRGVNAVGVEQSASMVKCSLAKNPALVIKCANIEDPLTFDEQIFTHIFGLYFTVYQFRDKKQFFRHCYKWLKPNGCLVLHLVNKDKFDMTIPVNKTAIAIHDKIRIQEHRRMSEVDLGDCHYKINYDMSAYTPIQPITVVRETFTDKMSGNVRQNEMTLWMDDMQDIIKIAKWCGFNPVGMMNLEKTGDSNQYLCFLERTI